MKLAFFDTKPYDHIWFDPLTAAAGHEIKFFEYKLNAETAFLAAGYPAVCAFVNDVVDEATIETLYRGGTEILLLRCAGYNNVDFKYAYGKIHVLRVPSYSPAAIAEHAAALLLTVNRKTHRAWARTRDNNFSINGLMGFDLNGKTAGVVGTGQIGQFFARICLGFGMRVLAFDPFPKELEGVEYVPLEQLLQESHVISLHCPLTPQTTHIINDAAIAKMRVDAILINTSRGELVAIPALIEALKSGRLGGAGLDVYEEESEYFFEDHSSEIIADDDLERLLTFPHVVITSHQGFFTKEAMRAIAEVTMENLDAYVKDKELNNEICYHCSEKSACPKEKGQKRCF